MSDEGHKVIVEARCTIWKGKNYRASSSLWEKLEIDFRTMYLSN